MTGNSQRFRRVKVWFVGVNSILANLFSIFFFESLQNFFCKNLFLSFIVFRYLLLDLRHIGILRVYCRGGEDVKRKHSVLFFVYPLISMSHISLATHYNFSPSQRLATFRRSQEDVSESRCHSRSYFDSVSLLCIGLFSCVSVPSLILFSPFPETALEILALISALRVSLLLISSTDLSSENRWTLKIPIGSG